MREGECNKEGSGETCMYIEEYVTIVTNDNHHSNQ